MTVSNIQRNCDVTKFSRNLGPRRGDLLKTRSHDASMGHKKSTKCKGKYAIHGSYGDWVVFNWSILERNGKLTWCFKRFFNPHLSKLSFSFPTTCKKYPPQSQKSKVHSLFFGGDEGRKIKYTPVNNEHIYIPFQPCLSRGVPSSLFKKMTHHVFSGWFLRGRFKKAKVHEQEVKLWKPQRSAQANTPQQNNRPWTQKSSSQVQFFFLLLMQKTNLSFKDAPGFLSKKTTNKSVIRFGMFHQRCNSQTLKLRVFRTMSLRESNLSGSHIENILPESNSKST